MEEKPLAPICGEALKSLEKYGIRHGFFTRQGGYSKGIYRELNAGLGSGDDSQIVAKNRALIATYLGTLPKSITSPHQVHSSNALIVDAPLSDPKPKADALVTNTPNLAIGIVTADCGPVLFADETARVIGAAHAGWQGALNGVLESTIDAMVSLGAKRENIKATLGPSISAQSYEVGPEFIERFCIANDGNQIYFAQSPTKANHALFDLQQYSLDRLVHARVQAQMTGHCTYLDKDRFFSYRRTTHLQEPDYGRQMSAIILE